MPDRLVFPKIEQILQELIVDHENLKSEVARLRDEVVKIKHRPLNHGRHCYIEDDGDWVCLCGKS